MYAVLADSVMVLHFGYLAYVALGGFLGWRWPRWLIAHLGAVAWGYSTIAFNLPCPLTDLEQSFHRRAGEPGLDPGGFIDHYLEGVIYPAQYTPAAQILVSVLVLVSWLGAIYRWRSRVGMRARNTGRPHA